MREKYWKCHKNPTRQDRNAYIQIYNFEFSMTESTFHRIDCMKLLAGFDSKFSPVHGIAHIPPGIVLCRRLARLAGFKDEREIQKSTNCTAKPHWSDVWKIGILGPILVLFDPKSTLSSFLDLLEALELCMWFIWQTLACICISAFKVFEN